MNGRQKKILVSKKRVIWGIVSVLIVATGLMRGSTGALAAPAVGMTYYVNSSGSDNNSGFSNEPWKTIQKAANTMVSGDTVVVSAGTYNERVQVSRSGAASALITYQAGGAVVTKGFSIYADYIEIDGFEITDTPDSYTDGIGIYLEGSHCLLENNYIHYATRGGILLNVNPGYDHLTSECTVRNNRLYHNSQYGITVKGQNHLVEGNEVWRSIQHHPNWADSPSWADADGMRFFGSGHIFRKNYIHDITFSDPENVDPHIDAFQTWDNQYGQAGKNCIFEQNEVYLPDRYTTGFQLEGGIDNVIIRNNIVRAFRGSSAYKNGGEPYSTPKNISIVNNLFVGSLDYSANQYPVGLSLYDATNAVVQNNIIVEQRGQTIYLQSSTGIDVDYNLIYNSDGSTLEGTPRPNDLWMVDPLFANLAGGDYYLQADSPAIDAGINLEILVQDDFDGNLRPQSHEYDIGIYEFLLGSDEPQIKIFLPLVIVP